MLVASSPIFAGTVGAHTEVLPFTGAGRGQPTELAGFESRQLPPGPEIAGVAQAASDSDRAVHVAAFELAPSDLQKALASPERLRLLLHDALFDANPDTHDAHLWDPRYRRWDGQTQSLIVSSLERRGAFEAFSRMAQALPDQVETLVDSFLARDTTHLYEVHWDNKDDTAFDGLIALDAKMGLVRVLMSNDFA